jgi:beta-glucosidase
MRTLAKMNLSLKIKVIQLIANAKVASPDATFRPEDSTNQLRKLIGAGLAQHVARACGMTRCNSNNASRGGSKSLPSNVLLGLPAECLSNKQANRPFCGETKAFENRPRMPAQIARGLVAFMVIGLLSGTESRAEDSVEAEVEKILKQITLAEKLDYIGGINAMSIRPIPRLDIPEIRMSDGPLGVRQDKPSARYPAGIALAATWNRTLAREEGAAMGRDCRARGIHVLLAPGININRVPFCGRNFEYLSGEDPYLAAQMVVPFILGVQGEGVVATAKHFAANNQEYNRMNIDVIVGERALREIYLPGFEAAVRNAKVGAVMDAYNKLNGAYCTENEYLNDQVLKKEWQFEGVLMSDWGATHSASGPALHGLDLEMPSGYWMNYENLMPAIERGELSVKQIDEKVHRILRLIVRTGFLRHPQRDDSIPENNPESGKTALAVAREGIVLLKNERKILPLDRTKTKKIAVFGPDAHPGVPAGWGSSYVAPFYCVSVLDGLKNRKGPDTIVDYFDVGVGNFGTSQFEHETESGRYESGLEAEYFDNLSLAGEPILRRVDQRIDFDWAAENVARGVLPSQFTVRWSGLIHATASSVHVFRARADSGIRVFLDNELIIDDWKEHAAHPDVATRTLIADGTYKLRIEYKNSGGGGAVAQFGWASLQVPDAAKEYDAVVVCVGFDNGSEGEGSDRSFELPDCQDDLIRDIAAKNPNTIVVLNSGGNIDMHRWLDSVPALLHAWYPGQEGGNALAEILFGDVNPSAKLPVTFEARKEDNPAYDSYPSSDGGITVRYAEGIYVGYRGDDHFGIAPLFPFGFGLSYTKFKYADMRIEQEESGVAVTVSFDLTNAGEKEGAEIAELYVLPEHPAIDRPPKELKGFEKLFLAPGETKHVVMKLDERSFAYFDPARSNWRTDPGTYEIAIGASSRDLRIRQSFQLHTPR